jgi:tetratricopeptide (TPR) repeat protein
MKKSQKGNLKQKNQSGKIDFSYLLGIAIIFILGIIIYSNSFNCAFHLDDKTSIVDNMTIRDLSDLNAIWNYSHGRFIAYFTFAVNYHFGELNIEGYHLFNLIIHLFNASLIYWLTLMILSSPALKQYAIIKDKKIIALFTALLFVSHPLATQSVTYIVQRLASLVTLFYLLSVAFYIKSRLTQKGNFTKYGTLAIALVSAVLAMFTKQNAFTLPLTLILIEFCFFQNKKFSINFKDFRVLLSIAAFALITLVILSNYSLSNIFTTLTPDSQNNFTRITPTNYLFTQFSVIVKYIQLLFLPINLNLDYDFRVSNSFFEIRTLLSFLFLLSLVALAIYQYKKNRIITFGIGWFFITLSVESSIIPISDVIFEHRTYLPSFGFFIILSSIIYSFLWKRYKLLAIAILVIIIGTNSFMTYERNEIWKSKMSLLNDVISKSPNKARPYNNRGSLFKGENKFDRAIQDFTKAIALKPNYALPYYNRGIVYSKQKKNENALKDYSKAIELNPDYYKAYCERGNLLQSQNKFDRAIQDYNKAIELNPNYAIAYNNTGIVFKKKKKLDAALENYNKAIELNPDYFEAYGNRGEVHLLLKNYPDAVQNLNTAIELNPEFANAYANRGLAEIKLGNIEKACLDFKRAIVLGIKQVEEWNSYKSCK